MKKISPHQQFQVEEIRFKWWESANKTLASSNYLIVRVNGEEEEKSMRKNGERLKISWTSCHIQSHSVSFSHSFALTFHPQGVEIYRCNNYKTNEPLSHEKKKEKYCKDTTQRRELSFIVCHLSFLSLWSQSVPAIGKIMKKKLWQ